MPHIDPLAPLMMLELHKLGCNVSWIAQLMDCSRDRVYRQLQLLIDLPRLEKIGRQKKQEVSETRKQEVRDLAEAGISVVDIAQVMEIDLPRILRGHLRKKSEKTALFRLRSHYT